MDGSSIPPNAGFQPYPVPHLGPDRLPPGVTADEIAWAMLDLMALYGTILANHSRRVAAAEKSAQVCPPVATATVPTISTSSPRSRTASPRPRQEAKKQKQKQKQKQKART